MVYMMKLPQLNSIRLNSSDSPAKCFKIQKQTDEVGDVRNNGPFATALCALRTTYVSSMIQKGHS